MQPFDACHDTNSGQAELLTCAQPSSQQQQEQQQQDEEQSGTQESMVLQQSPSETKTQKQDSFSGQMSACTQ